MKPLETGKKVSILGLKGTGFQSALFLSSQGYQVFGSDVSGEEEVRKNAEILQQKGISSEWGKHTFETILDADWVLISPGIPPQSDIYKAVKASGKPIYSEIEVASWFSPAHTVIAVTGSCGKTTTATLLSEILKASGREVVLCGNIGNPWIGEIPHLKTHSVVVLEVSSFQLMHCKTFAPSVGILLNVYPNHQDWHSSMREYAWAKLNLFQAMKSSDVMICRKDDEEKYFPEFETEAKKIYSDQTFKGIELLNPNEAVLMCAAEVLNCPPHIVREVLRDFPGIEHRLEKFAEWKGISFVNDSKATTPASLLWALEKYPDQKVVLIAGGKAKSKDFGTLWEKIRQKVKCAVLIGTGKEMIAEAWQGAAPILQAEDFESACQEAFSRAQPEDVVLLSPACASFDMFKNYQERGALFKQIIRKKIQVQS